MTLKKLTLLALATLALAACGGGDGAPAIDAAPHIKGTVLGAVFNAQTSLSAHDHDEGATLHFDGSVTSGESEQASWNVYALPKAKGTYACGTSVNAESETLAVYFEDYRNGAEDYYFADGTNGSSCTITVEDVSATEISGRFEAKVAKDVEGNPISQVTNGSFRVPLDTAEPV